MPWKTENRSDKFTCLRFADDINVLSKEKQKLEILVQSLDKACISNIKEISTEKSKLTKGKESIQTEIKIKGQKLGIATNFKTLSQFFLQMMVPNTRLHHELHTPL